MHSSAKHINEKVQSITSKREKQQKEKYIQDMFYSWRVS